MDAAGTVTESDRKTLALHKVTLALHKVTLALHKVTYVVSTTSALASDPAT